MSEGFSLSIPGNVKQKALPFVLNPNATINKKTFTNSASFDTGGVNPNYKHMELSSNEFKSLTPEAKEAQLKKPQNLAAIGPQYFTYKENKHDIGGGFGKLNIVPSSYAKYMESDVSNQLLYSSNALSSTNQINLASVINNIPGVQIREYLPDTKLDQLMNIFSELLSIVMDFISGALGKSEEKKSTASIDGLTDGPGSAGQQAAKTAGQRAEADQDAKVKKLVEDKTKAIGDDAKGKIKIPETNGIMSKIMGITKYVAGYITGGTNPDFYTEMTNLKEMQMPGYIEKWGKNKKGVEEPLDKTLSYILQFPFLMYYRLQSCLTVNIYEVPGLNQDKSLYDSDGTGGWGDAGWRLTFGNIPFVSKMLEGIFGNIGTHFTPWWDAKEGTKVAEPQINIKLDLFNDTNEAAMINFIFVNTIVPNNKWIQYNMFQHSSSLYDIKLEGYNRLFACTGKFSVKADGVMRTPPDDWLKSLCSKHAQNGITPEYLKSNNIIKIPDVYHVDMTFTSLLPANFNNYLFTYVCNDDQITTYQSKGLFQKSLIVDTLKNGVTKMGENVSIKWSNLKYKGGIIEEFAVKKDNQNAPPPPAT